MEFLQAELGGGILSMTVILAVQVAVLPVASLAVTVTGTVVPA